MVTPARRKSATISSIWRSVQFFIEVMSDLPCDSLIDHLCSKCYQYQAKDQAQDTGLGFHENLDTEQGAGEDAQHDGHGESGVDVAAIQVHSGAGRGGHA